MQGKKLEGRLTTDARKVTFIKAKSLVYISTHIRKITFKSFLITTYSLEHEKRGTIQTLDFHRKQIWISLNIILLPFVLT